MMLTMEREQGQGDLLALVSRDTTLKRVASTNGGEWAGPCSFCGGRDRLRVWPNQARGQARGSWWCRVCGRGGDEIACRVERGEMTPREAGETRRGWRPERAGRDRGAAPGAVAAPTAVAVPERVAAPARGWQDAAGGFVERCAARLWTDEGERARAWLRARGLTDEAMAAARLGYYRVSGISAGSGGKADGQEWATWGEKRVKLYRGIVIPWLAEGELWRVNIRRPAGEPKYYSPGGWSNGLYQADRLEAGGAAVVVEGELDALLLAQEAGDLTAAVALGSTSGARRVRWVCRLAACGVVLVALDADAQPEKGDRAAAWWVRVLGNARRCRPWWGDPGEMAQAGVGLREWVAAQLVGFDCGWGK